MPRHARGPKLYCPAPFLLLPEGSELAHWRCVSDLETISLCAASIDGGGQRTPPCVRLNGDVRAERAKHRCREEVVIVHGLGAALLRSVWRKLTA